MDLSLVPYQDHEESSIKYKECMRNHAASIGGHANDGCGEFMPSRADHDNSLTCAACGCHRNFHRQEVPGHQYHQPAAKPLLLFKNPMKVLLSSKPVDTGYDHDYDDRRSETPEREEVNLNVGPSGHGGRSTTSAKSKRFRTKFTQEQKERMFEFAEKIGWRIQRQDDNMLNQFCSEVGVKRNVLKVWMHNNKNAHRRRESASQSSIPPQPVGV